MAQSDHIIATLAEEDFRVNGCSVLSVGDAEEYFECAHGMLALVTGVVSEAGSISAVPTNEQILFAALRGAEKLLELGMWQREHERVALTQRLAA